MWTQLASSRLYYTQGTSDKCYEVRVEHDLNNPATDRPFRVSARYGRRGSLGGWSIKNHYFNIVNAIDAASEILRGKYNKGYTAHESGEVRMTTLPEFERGCRRALADLAARSQPGESDHGAARARRQLDPETPRQATTRARVERERISKEARDNLLRAALSNPDFDDFQPRVVDLGGVDDDE